MSNKQEAPNYCEDWKRKKEFFIPCMIDETGCACYRYLQTLTPASVEQPKQERPDILPKYGPYERLRDLCINFKNASSNLQQQRYIEEFLKEPEQPSEGQRLTDKEIEVMSYSVNEKFESIFIPAVQRARFGKLVRDEIYRRGSGPGVDTEKETFQAGFNRGLQEGKHGASVDGELLEALKRLNKYANSANELYSGSPMDEEMERLIARAEGGSESKEGAVKDTDGKETGVN